MTCNSNCSQCAIPQTIAVPWGLARSILNYYHINLTAYSTMTHDFTRSKCTLKVKSHRLVAAAGKANTYCIKLLLCILCAFSDILASAVSLCLSAVCCEWGETGTSTAFLQKVKRQVCPQFREPLAITTAAFYCNFIIIIIIVTIKKCSSLTIKPVE